jgi:hypothetical protein
MKRPAKKTVLVSVGSTCLLVLLALALVTGLAPQKNGQHAPQVKHAQRASVASTGQAPDEATLLRDYSSPGPFEMGNLTSVTHSQIKQMRYGDFQSRASSGLGIAGTGPSATTLPLPSPQSLPACPQCAPADELLQGPQPDTQVYVVAVRGSFTQGSSSSNWVVFVLGPQGSIVAMYGGQDAAGWPDFYDALPDSSPNGPVTMTKAATS